MRRIARTAAVVSWGPPTEGGQALTAVHVVVIDDGDLTQWRVATPNDRQLVVPGAAGAEVYLFAQSAGGYGPLGGPVEVTP